MRLSRKRLLSASAAVYLAQASANAADSITQVKPSCLRRCARRVRSVAQLRLGEALASAIVEEDAIFLAGP
jgi:hypothetical protein